MTVAERVIREVEICDRHGRWVKAKGIYPEEWICARKGCNRVTKSRNRVVSRRLRQRKYPDLVYCSTECRAIDVAEKRRKK